MRQGHNKRSRGRNRKGPNPLQRSYESNGPDVKVRGTALHVAEKYVTLARDAASSGDRVAEQNYLQHAEHYFRIVAAAQAQMPQQQAQPSQRDEDDDEDEDRNTGQNGERGQSRDDNQPQFGLSDPQPYVNGDGIGHDTDSGERREMNGDGGGNSRPRRTRRPRPERKEAEAASEEPVTADD